MLSITSQFSFEIIWPLKKPKNRPVKLQQVQPRRPRRPHFHPLQLTRGCIGLRLWSHLRHLYFLGYLFHLYCITWTTLLQQRVSTVIKLKFKGIWKWYRANPPIHLHLIFEISSSKNLVWQTWLFFCFELDFAGYAVKI